MKKRMIFTLVAITMFSVLTTSCGPIMRAQSGTRTKDLIKRVSTETGCPSDSIKVISQSRGTLNAGNASYALDVCGVRLVYKQIGSVFMRDTEAEKLMQEIQK